MDTGMFDAYSVSEVGLKLPQELTSLTCKKSTQSVFIGSRDGHLFIYNKNTNPGRRGYELDECRKKFERRAVTQIQISEEKQLLLCVSDGQLAAHNLENGTERFISVLNKVKPVTSFAFFSNEDDENFYIITSSRKKIQLFQWIGRDFVEVRLDCNINFSETPVNLRTFNNRMVFSVRDEYFLAGLYQRIDDNGEIFWLMTPVKIGTTSSAPIIIDIFDKKMVGLGRHESLIVYREDSSHPCIPEVKFSDAPTAIVYDPPYVTALLSKGRIEIRTLFPSILVQQIVLSKAQFICSGASGQLYVSSSGTPSDVWVLDTTPNMRKNVSCLVNEKHFELAMQIVEMSNVFSDENKLEIKRQAAANLFHLKRYEECFELHKAIDTDVFKVIQLFPDLLPDIGKQKVGSPVIDLAANDKKRALLALGNYLSEIRADHVKRLEKERFGETLPKEEIQNLQRTLIIVDTTLLNCYLQTKPMLVDSLLRLHNNTCSFEDAEGILKKAHRLPSLFVLYETRKKHALALELLYTQSQNPDADPFFEGTSRMVEYLQTLGNTNLELIFQYAKWVLSKNFDDGLAIFIGEESDLAKTLDREKVLDFLRSHCMAAVIPYLEHLIYKWEETIPQYHESLLEQYIIKVKTLMKDYVHAFPDDENIARAGEEDGDLGKYRMKLIRFLQYSLQYSPQAILFQLGQMPLYEERALLLGRMKLHDQALTIYTSILTDFKSAEEYCQMYYDRNDWTNSQVYLQWLKAYLQPYEPQKAGLSETLSVSIPPPDIPSAIRVLKGHADRIDTVAALSEFPDETNLRTLARALIAVMQTVRDTSTALALRNSISGAALNRALNRRRQLMSTRILVNNASECTKCGKKIGNSAFVRFPADDSLVHFYCQFPAEK